MEARRGLGIGRISPLNPCAICAAFNPNFVYYSVNNPVDGVTTLGIDNAKTREIGITCSNTVGGSKRSVSTGIVFITVPTASPSLTNTIRSTALVWVCTTQRSAVAVSKEPPTILIAVIV